LQTADGKVIEGDGLRKRSFYPLPVRVGAGQSATVFRGGKLGWQPDGKALKLSLPDGAGGGWWFDGLAPGKYRLGFRYHNAEAAEPRGLGKDPGQPFWVGEARAEPVEIEIVAARKGGKDNGDRTP
jgi:hypothetical protein